MIILNAADTLRAVASADSTVTVTVMGDEVTTATGANDYKALYQGQPAAAGTTLITVGAGKQHLIKSIHIANTTASSRTIALTVNGTAASNTILATVTIPAGYTLTYAGDGWSMVDTTGSRQISSLAVYQASDADLTVLSGPPLVPGGRLTLTSATPLLSSDVTAATAVYYTPCVSNQVPIYDGSTRWNRKVFTELTLTLSATGGHHDVDKNYDVFVFNYSGTIRIATGPAWTSDTARGTGAGTTQLSLQDGLNVNTVSMTVRNSTTTYTVAAKAGTYLGTFRTSAAGQTCMIMLPAAAAGGSNARLYLWNAFHGKPHSAVTRDSTDTWTYTTDTWRVFNGNSNNRASFVIGLSGGRITAFMVAASSNSTSLTARAAGIGYDSESALADGSFAMRGTKNTGANVTADFTSRLSRPAVLGFHYVAPLERSAATGTCTWLGDNGDTTQYQTGIQADLEM